MSSISMTVKKR